MNQKKIIFKLRSGAIFNSKQGEVTVKLKSTSGDINIDEALAKKVEVQALISFGLQQGLLFLIIVLIVVGIFAPKILKSVRRTPQA